VKQLFAYAALLAVTCLLAGAVAPAEPASTEPGTVVFDSTRDGDFDIYAVNLDGTGLTQLTHNDKLEDSSPVPSPDGRLIAFYNTRLDAAVMNADGTGVRKLAGCSTFSAWSPDSTRVVCGVSGLSIVDVATGAVTPLTQHGSGATWSPDGRTIAFQDQQQLWVVAATGGTPRRLSARAIEGITWSPDSQRLAFGAWVGSGRARRVDLFTITVGGTDERQLVEGAGSPVWSSDGTLLAVVKHLRKPPRDFYDVYTVKPDGSSLQRVTVSRGGESSYEPSLTGDGAGLVYLRGRYRGGCCGGSDVFVTSPSGGAGRALTQPFPMGGGNGEAHWRPGPALVAPPPEQPPTISLPLTRKITLADPVEQLAADGPRAVAYDHSTCSLHVWNARTRRSARTPRLCPREGSLGSVAVAGKRLAWLTFVHGNTEDGTDLWTWQVGARRPAKVTTTVSFTEGGGDDIGYLLGSDRTIAFTRFHYAKRHVRREAWLLLPRSGNRCPLTDPEYGKAERLCRRLRGASGGVTEAVDGDRVLTLAPSGAARLLSASGRLRRAWNLGRKIVNAELGGRSLAVQRGASVTAYDTVSGAKRQPRSLAANEGLSPYLLDVQDGLVVYLTGGAVHLLRLSDGHDVALDLPGAAPPFDAKLESGGLFVAWNQMYARHPGRLAFVPSRIVKARLSRG
jgi:Tol biopolymer transport system component